MRTLCLFAMLTLALSACAVAPPGPEHACYHRHEAEEKDIGYCAALRSGDTLYLSGTTSAGPMPDAIKAIYSRLQKTLTEQGLSFADVIKETVFTTDLDAFIRGEGLRKPFYGDSTPAATWVQVQRLYDPSDVLEVELEARYPKPK